MGSSLIVMSIVGGALLPPVLGYISDRFENIQLGYIVPMVCFAVIAYFGFAGHRVQKLINHFEHTIKYLSCLA